MNGYGWWFPWADFNWERRNGEGQGVAIHRTDGYRGGYHKAS